MIKYQRTILQDKYHVIEIFECPTELMMYAAGLGAENITVENYNQYGKESQAAFHINCENKIIMPKLSRYNVDFQISKSEFFDLTSLWHASGCYAVFCSNDKDMPFKVSELSGVSRYSALDNFQWTLELAIPGSASDGWGHIASPDKNIIDKIEEQINNLIE